MLDKLFGLSEFQASYGNSLLMGMILKEAPAMGKVPTFSAQEAYRLWERLILVFVRTNHGKCSKGDKKNPMRPCSLCPGLGLYGEKVLREGSLKNCHLS